MLLIAPPFSPHAIILATTYNQSLDVLYSFITHHDRLCAKSIYNVCLVLVFESSEAAKVDQMLDNYNTTHLNHSCVLVNNQSSGFPSCLNFGIDKTSSNIILRIDADDLMTDSRLDS